MMLEDVAINGSERRAQPGSAETAWRARSVCRQHPTHWWFAGSAQETVLAKGICSECVVAGECLEFAVARPELLGIWGATTPAERASIRRVRRDPHAAAETAGAIGTMPFAKAGVGRAATGVGVDGAAAPDAGPRPAVAATAVPEYRSAGRDLAIVVAPEPDDADALLTPAEAARLLGVTPNTVTRWSRAGRIAAIRTMGGHRRFRRSDIERALSEGCDLSSG